MSLCDATIGVIIIINFKKILCISYSYIYSHLCILIQVRGIQFLSDNIILTGGQDGTIRKYVKTTITLSQIQHSLFVLFILSSTLFILTF